MTYKRDKVGKEPLTKDLILFLHRMLMDGIDDAIAGRLWRQGEYVRVDTHTTPLPRRVTSERVIHSFI